jgi:hypothetical protein
MILVGVDVEQAINSAAMGFPSWRLHSSILDCEG